MECMHRPVMVRIKNTVITGKITGYWEDRDGSGPVLSTTNGQLFIDENKIIRYLDTDEIPHRSHL